MNKLAKGDHRPVHVTKQGNRRVFFGLSWDPSESRGVFARLKEVVLGKKSFYDLDLACFLFDKDHHFLDVISGKNGKIVDQSGGIYHSGDDQEGKAEGDDEQLSVELSNVPEAVHHIIVTASVESGHKFSEILSPHIRFVDAYSERHFSQVDLQNADSAKASSYVFMELYRKEHQDGRWHMNFIDAYRRVADYSQWHKQLKKYLSVTD